MVDVQNDPNATGIMLAFLPTDSSWCKQDLPHMTLVYAGTTADRTPSEFSEFAKDAASAAMLIQSFGLRVTGTSQFGVDPEKVDVLTFQPSSQLLAVRQFVEDWNKSEHPFNPHATIGPSTFQGPGYVPDFVYFDRLLLAWGDQNLTFWLK